MATVYFFRRLHLKSINSFMIKKKTVLTVTLNPALDHFIKVDDFKAGKDNELKEQFYRAGGKGINVSHVLKILKIDNVATGFLGGVTGEYLERSLNNKKIFSDFVHIKGQTRTNLTMIDQKRNLLTRIIDCGPLVSKKEIALIFAKIRILLLNCEYVVFSGRHMRGAPYDIYEKLIFLAKRYHKKTLLDTSGEFLLRGIKARPYLIKPNLPEAEYLFQEKLNTFTKIKKAIKELLARGIPNVIISLDKRGAVATNGKEFWWAHLPEKRIANSVGCGDAFIAGLLYSLIHGQSFKEALRMAVATATSYGLLSGKELPSPGNIFRLVGRVKLLPI